MWRRSWAALVPPHGRGDAHGVRVGRGRRDGVAVRPWCATWVIIVLLIGQLFIMQDAGCATRAMHGNGGRWCPRGPGGAVGMSAGGQARRRPHPGPPAYQTSVLSPYSTTRLHVCRSHVQRAASTTMAAGGAPAGRVVPWGCPWVGKTIGGPIWARLRTKQASCLGPVSRLTGFFYVHRAHARVAAGAARWPQGWGFKVHRHP